VRFRAVLAPTVPLSRRIFEAPTQYYKAGIVLLAWHCALCRRVPAGRCCRAAARSRIGHPPHAGAVPDAWDRV